MSANSAAPRPPAAIASGSLAILVALLTGWFFAATARSLFAAWQSPEYSYGYLVPFVCLGWGWKLYRERKPPLRPAAGGLALAACAVLLHLFGDLAANNWLDEYAIVVMAAGFIAALMGWAALRALLPAVFFLSFAVPLPPTTQAGLTAGLQLLSSTLSVAGLHLLGVPVFRQGNIIDLGVYQLQVAEACSGLRYLFPFLGFGYLFAFLFERGPLRRALLILSTIPIAIFMNALRIVGVGVSVDAWGIGMAQGFLHAFEGWLVFLGCLALLFAVSRLLALIPARAEAPRPLPAPAAPNPRLALPLAALAVLMALGCAGAWLAAREETAPPPARLPLLDFPLHLGDWRGETQSLPPDQLAALRLTDYFMADYRGDGGAPPVNFYIAYYASQRRGAAPHSPLVCIPGSGWQIVSLQSSYPVRNAAGQKIVTVERALIASGAAEAVVYFWYDERGRDLTTAPERKWYLAKDSVLRGRSDGALVRAVVFLGDGLTQAQADRELAAFLALAVPRLDAFVPR